MPDFTDASGRTWRVRVTLGTLRDLEHAIGKPVFEVIADPARLRSEIIGTAEVVGKGLYIACRQEAQERRVGQEDFFQAISGPVIAAATRAWVEALAECFPVPDSANPKGKPEENQAPRPTLGAAGGPRTSRAPGPGRIFTALRRLRAWLTPGRTPPAS